MFIIGIIGKKGAGKTALTQSMDQLTVGRNVYYIAFGDALKEMLIKAGMVTYDQVYGKKTAISRWLMQKVGTEIFRKQIDQDYWVKKVKERLSEIEAGDPDAIVLIHDVRFPEEADLIRNNRGYLVRVWRPLKRWQYWLQRLREFKGANDHASETAQDAIQANLTVKNAGTLADLQKSGVEVFLILYERYKKDKQRREERAALASEMDSRTTLLMRFDPKEKEPCLQSALAAEKR